MRIRVPKFLSRNEFLSNIYNLPEIIRQHKSSSTSEFFWATWKKKIPKFAQAAYTFCIVWKTLQCEHLNIWNFLFCPTFNRQLFFHPHTYHAHSATPSTHFTHLPRSHTNLFIFFKNLSSFFAMASIVAAMSKSFAIIIAICCDDKNLLRL